MKLTFKTIKIENFLSLGNIELNLNDRGYVFVKGINLNTNDNALSNGSGKSSLWEAISWCLCGETIRGGCKDIVNLNTEGGALVELVFEVDGKEYVVIRTKDHSIHKTNLKIFIDGQDKSGKGIRDSEKLLKEYLPDLTSSLLGSVIILGQGMPQRFSNNTPVGRKEVLEKLSKSDFMIQDLKDRINCRKLELNNELRQLQDESLTLQTTYSIKLEEHTKLLNTLKELESDVDYEAQIQESLKCINELVAKLKALEVNRIEVDNTISSLYRQSRDMYANKEKEISVVRNQYDPQLEELKLKLHNALVAHQVAEANYKQLSSITDICPTCKQKLPDVHKPDLTEASIQVQNTLDVYNQINTQLSTLHKEFIDSHDAIESKYKQQDKDYSNQLSQLEKEKRATESDISASTQVLRSHQECYDKLVHQSETLQDTIKSTKVKLDELSKETELLSSQITDTKVRIQDVEKHIEIINKFNTVASRDFRGYLLLNVIEYINIRAKEYAKEIFLNDNIEFKLDGNILNIAFDSKQYESLSGGEKQKVDLIIQFAIRDMMCNCLDFSSNILVVDEIFDNLDKTGCEQVINLISNKLRDISSVYIISHHTDIAIPYDDEITVIKNANGVSYIK